MKKPNILTPYIISSEMFLKSIDRNVINSKQCQFILKNINLVAIEHKSKKYILEQMYSQAKKAIEEINKYTHISKTPSRRTVEFMADENYYKFIENNVQAFSNNVSRDDEHEI